MEANARTLDALVILQLRYDVPRCAGQGDYVEQLTYLLFTMSCSPLVPGRKCRKDSASYTSSGRPCIARPLPMR